MYFRFPSKLEKLRSNSQDIKS